MSPTPAPRTTAAPRPQTNDNDENVPEPPPPRIESANIFGGTPYEAAPPEVQQSRALGEGLILVPAARQDVYDVGVQQALGSKLRLDVDFWERRVRNVADQAQFGAGIKKPTIELLERSVAPLALFRPRCPNTAGTSTHP